MEACKALELVHVKIGDPTRTPLISSARHFLLVVHDFSQRQGIFFLKIR
jgi:hypothetical protein